jgi:hypothetical protein
VATALQHATSILSPRIQATSTEKHHPYAGQKNDALTFKTDQSVGAAQSVLSALMTRFAVWPSDTPSQITVVKADPKLIKRRPVDLGGMDIPFQGFSIWSVLEGGARALSDQIGLMREAVP